MRYSDIIEKVQPRQSKIEELERKLIEMKVQSEQKVLQLHELKKQLDALNEQLETSTEKLKAFRVELDSLEFKQCLYSKIATLLNTQKERWIHIVTQNQTKSQLKLQYCLLVACFQTLHTNTKLNLLEEMEKLQ